jgi:type IX secretion system PorP/SprF family membrane protein
MKRIFYICLLAFGAFSTTLAQSDPFFFQQTNNRGLINPAAVGKGGDVNAMLTVRQQWVGFKGITTQALQVTGFAPSLHSGFGLKCIVDAFGPQQSNNIKLNYAYYVPFGDVALLSLGLGMGVMHNIYKGGEHFIVRDRDDPYIPEPQAKTSPDFDVGIEFNTPQFEIGVAVTHVIYGRYNPFLVRPIRNFYVYSRVKLHLNRMWDLIPGATWHNVRNAHTLFDKTFSNTYEFNVAFRHNNNFCVNLVFRNPLDFGMIVGLDIIAGFRLMYSYDYGFSNIGNYNKGTHELTVLYNFPMNTTFVQNKLRFFRWKMF